MRRLIDIASKSTASVLVGLLLLLCSVAALSTHANMKSSSGSTSNCSASCHSHGQHVAINALADRDAEDDKEPIPFEAEGLHIPMSLLLLYVLPIFGVSWFVYSRRDIHLTVQLRI